MMDGCAIKHLHLHLHMILNMSNVNQKINRKR
jgi:hypothetical protein